MSKTSVIADLARWGPGSAGRRASLGEARAYCRRLARTHYENFSVASILVPRRLRPHFYAIYAYCRWADDLADEAGSANESLVLLDWWERQLADCYAGDAAHPVFVALAATIDEFAIEQSLLGDLLTAFRRDQQQTRYETFAALREYCRFSADPVGRLVLCLGRCYDAVLAALSDRVCTGLQLANFCQDVARDWDRGRIYLPQETFRDFGYTEAMFAGRTVNEPFRRALRFEVDRAESWLLAGLPLADRVPRELQVQVELFARGGLAILGEVRRADYDVWRRRPTVSRGLKLGLLASTWWRRRIGKRPTALAAASDTEAVESAQCVSR